MARRRRTAPSSTELLGGQRVHFALRLRWVESMVERTNESRAREGLPPVRRPPKSVKDRSEFWRYVEALERETKDLTEAEAEFVKRHHQGAVAVADSEIRRRFGRFDPDAVPGEKKPRGGRPPLKAVK